MLLGRGPTQRTTALNSLPRGREAGLSLRCSRPVTCPLLQSPLHPTPVSLEASDQAPETHCRAFSETSPCPALHPPVPASPHAPKPGYDLTISIHPQVSPASSLLRKEILSYACSFKKDFQPVSVLPNSSLKIFVVFIDSNGGI